nr:movement protein [Green Sichuan pepper idaeovirus]
MFSRSSSSRSSQVGSRSGTVFDSLGSTRKKDKMVRSFAGNLQSSLRGPRGTSDEASRIVSLPGLRIPTKPSSLTGDNYLMRKGISLPIVHQQRFLAADGKSVGESYLLDSSRTDLLDAAKLALKENKLIEFNRFKEFKKFSGKINEFSLVQASTYEKLIRKDRSAIHLNRLLIAVLPAVGRGIPGNVTIKIRDARLDAGYGTLFSCTNPVDCGYIYCINVGYSVPAAELDYKILIDFEDIPIKDGKSPIWVKTAFHLADSASPVFLEGTMCLGAEIVADSHREMLSTSALLLNEVNSNRKSFSGDNGELVDGYHQKARLDDITPLDSISQVDTTSSKSDSGEEILGNQEVTGGVYLGPPSHSVV